MSDEPTKSEFVEKTAEELAACSNSELLAYYHAFTNHMQARCTKPSPIKWMAWYPTSAPDLDDVAFLIGRRVHVHHRAVDAHHIGVVQGVSVCRCTIRQANSGAAPQDFGPSLNVVLAGWPSEPHPSLWPLPGDIIPVIWRVVAYERLEGEE